MFDKQKTISRECRISGIGLHTGCKVNLKLKPATENSGINFIRIDLPDKPIIKAHVANICNDEAKIPRSTVLGNEKVIIYTVEHLMSTLSGLGINNLTIEIDGEELPGMDGSALDYIKAIKEAGIEEQSADAEFFEIKEAIGAQENGSSIFIVPSDEFQVSYTLDYDNPFLKSQFFSSVIDSDTFEKEIAPCRTFCLEAESKELQSMGLGKGANYNNTLVVGKDGIKGNKVRFPDEFSRHKVLDCIGDLYLLGMPIKGHVFAVKSGHNLNIQLLKLIWQQKEKYSKVSVVPKIDFGDKKEIDINQIMKILPHRYPFLLVDRLIEIEAGKKVIGLKNVTINDNFFQGHFPTKPIMPGVLMVEAMAQTAGVMILTNPAHEGKVAFFSAIDNVKFRKVVSPGDQLLMEIEVVKDKSRIAQVRSVAKVADEIVAEADMMFTFVDASYLYS